MTLTMFRPTLGRRFGDSDASISARAEDELFAAVARMERAIIAFNDTHGPKLQIGLSHWEDFKSDNIPSPQLIAELSAGTYEGD